MKRNKRIVALVLTVVMLLLLCGCDALDEMRRNQAFYGEDTDVIWNSKIYKLLPSCDYLCPELNYETTIWVTADDVPVLLSTILSERPLTPSTDSVILKCDYEGGYFCREDMYEEMVRRIKETFVPKLICYSYTVYDEESFDFWTDTYTLTEEQTEAIALITSTVEPDPVGEGWRLDYDWSLDLEECSEDLLFRRSVMELTMAGSTYYLLLTANNETLVFQVPDGCNEIFGEIAGAYTQSQYAQWDDEEAFV